MPQYTSADQAARPEDVAGVQQEGVLSIMATSERAFGQVTGSQIQSLASDLTDAQLNLEAKRAEVVVAKTDIKSVQVEISSLAEKKRKLQHSIVAMEADIEGYEGRVKDLAKQIQSAAHTIVDSN
jgi:chromosome segregation ATPase